MLRTLIFGLLTLVLAAATTGRAQDGPKVEEGFTPLFNGKDLTGWRYSGPKGKALDGMTDGIQGNELDREAEQDPGILRHGIERIAAQVNRILQRPAEHPPEE